MLFNKAEILRNFEALRRPNGAFIAAPTDDYRAMWIRDQLYCTFAYWYLDEIEKCRSGVQLVFDLFKRYKKKILRRTSSLVEFPGAILHAKFHPDTLDEIVADDAWGHFQLDAVGLFLYVVADLHFKNVPTVRDDSDKEVLQLLLCYLRGVEYWDSVDFGIWEECRIRHSSSIGAVLGGLVRLKAQRIKDVDVPDSLINAGEKALRRILPYESRPDEFRDHCNSRNHADELSHDCDVAQLSLIWPYHVVQELSEQDFILDRLISGHVTDGGRRHRLLQTHGFNRYWGDDYYRSTEGKFKDISAEWPMFKFWISVIYSQRHEDGKAAHWFREGCRDIIDNKIPEAYQNGRPNDHTPLAWAHAIALIAFSKLSADAKREFVS